VGNNELSLCCAQAGSQSLWPNFLLIFSALLRTTLANFFAHPFGPQVPWIQYLCWCPGWDLNSLSLFVRPLFLPSSSFFIVLDLRD
jgi:hypothetical protein